MSNIFDLDSTLKNSPWSLNAAYILFPYLIKRAKDNKKITYKECQEIVDKVMNNPTGSGSAVKMYKPAYIIKLICDVIKKDLKFKIPLLNFIIVNKNTQKPGYGIGGFINLPTKEKEYKNNPSLQKKFDQKVQAEINKIFQFNKWDKVLSKFKSLPSPDLEYLQMKEDSLAKKSLKTLKNLAEKQEGKNKYSTPYFITRFPRSPEIAAYIKKQANGICELCQQKAPFQKKDGELFLESHHIKWLSQGGLDKIKNVVALCPNCHRKMHILNNSADVKKLEKWVTIREKNLQNKI